MRRILEFRQWGAFSDTLQPAREWTALAAVPEMELQEGDRVFELGPDADLAVWEGRRFQIRRRRRGSRKNRIIRELETWQAAQLFGGELPEWPPEGRVMEAFGRALLDTLELGATTLHEVVDVFAAQAEYAKDLVADLPEEELAESEPVHPDVALIRADLHRRAVHRLRQDGAGRLRAGDLVLKSGGWAGPIETDVPARIFELDRAELEALRELALNGPAGALEVLTGDTHLSDWKTLIDRRSWGLSAKEWHSDWWVVRPIRERVVPIQAPSELHALFELVHECGGTLQGEDRRS